MKAKADALIVSGARCTWWDDISKTGNTGPGRSGLPTCPHCGSPLYQHEPEVWWRNVDRYVAAHRFGYRSMVEWMCGQCFSSFKAAQEAYNRHLKDQDRGR